MCFPWENEGSEATLATHWTTHQVPRQRTRVVDLSGAACASMHVHGRAGKPKQLPRNAKNPRKPGVCSTGFRKLTERTGTEQPTNPLGKTHFLITRDAKYEVRRFQCLRRLGTLSIATNLQLICSPIYRVTNSRPVQIYRVTVFCLQGHLQGHIKNPREFTGSQVWSSDCDSFSVSIRHYLAACWMDSGPRGSCRSRSGMTACPSSVAPTDKARQR